MEINIQDLQRILKTFNKETKLNIETLIEGIKEAIAKVYLRHINAVEEAQVEVEINQHTGVIKAFHLQTVVEKIEEPSIEILLSEAQRYKKDAKVNDVVRVPIDINLFSRTTVNYIKQNLTNKIKDDQKLKTYNIYSSKIGELFTAKVDIVNERHAFVDIHEEKAYLAKKHWLPSDNLYPGKLIKVVLMEVDRNSKGSQLIVSRSTPEFILALLKQEIPEIKEKFIEVVRIVREVGIKTKIAVQSNDPSINSVGSIIGAKGHRLQSLQMEVPGEKIEIFKWNDNPYEFLESILQPVQLYGIHTTDVQDEDDNLWKKYVLIVDDRDLAMVIGKKGSNIRLISQLMQADCDVKGLSVAISENLKFEKTWVAEEMPDINMDNIDVHHLGEQENEFHEEEHQVNHSEKQEKVHVQLKPRSESLEEKLAREEAELAKKEAKPKRKSTSKSSSKTKLSINLSEQAPIDIKEEDIHQFENQIQEMKNEELSEVLENDISEDEYFEEE